MQVPIEVIFRNMDHSSELEEYVRSKAFELEEFFDRITACRVTVEAPHHHQRKGNRYEVRIHLSVPQKNLVVDRAPGNQLDHEDVQLAVRDAFNAARRQLQDYVRELRGKVTTHDSVPHGRVSVLTPDSDYGFITTHDGREIYFHANSLIDHDFERLEIGNEVRFTEELGDKGPQASTVHLVGRHNHHD